MFAYMWISRALKQLAYTIQIYGENFSNGVVSTIVICDLGFGLIIKTKVNLPTKEVLCGKTVIALTAAYSWSLTGCTFAPHESLPTQ